MRRLAAEADIVLENFRPGIMARFGLGWSDLSALNPRLVMLSISGFGQDGPERDRASYAGVIHAETGVSPAGARPTAGCRSDIEISMADTVTGLHGVVGVLAALRLRDATGVGQHVDLAMIDAMVASDDYLPNEVAAARPAGAGRRRRVRRERRRRRRRRAPRASPNEIIDAPGGPLIVMGEFKWIWKSIHERLGVADPTPPGRRRRRQGRGCAAQAWHDFDTSFATPCRAAGRARQGQPGVGRSCRRRRGADSPTLAHRGSFVRSTTPTALRVVRAPYRFSQRRQRRAGGRRRARTSTAPRSSPTGWVRSPPSRTAACRRHVRWAASVSARSTRAARPSRARARRDPRRPGNSECSSMSAMPRAKA